MIRTSHSVSAQRGSFQKFLGATLLAAAAAAAPAHAGVITFDDPSNFGPGMVFGGDAWVEDGYAVGFFANLPGDGYGSLVGMVYDGDMASCDTSSQICPGNKSGNYFGALNDTYLDMVSLATPGFKIKSFDAGFIGSNAALGSYPNPVGLVRILGITMSGASITQDFWFENPNQAQNFQLNTFNTSGTFANTVLQEALIYGFACNNAGNCQAFATDRGQFGIDNITTADVPEPATAAMVGLGLLGVAAARRRKTKA